MSVLNFLNKSRNHIILRKNLKTNCLSRNFNETNKKQLFQLKSGVSMKDFKL